MKQGQTEQKQFKVEIPFEYRLGLIVLKVNINGIDYDFVLDTGAPNVLSKELAQKLKLSSIANQKTGDSQGSSSKLGFVKIDKINIGGINFLNTGAAIADLQKSTEIACLKIDGFIGSNLMRKAIWQFDYNKQIITITNTIDSLRIVEPVSIIKFYPEITGTPLIDVNYNNIIDKGVKVDLGSNGDFASSKKMYAKLIEKETLPFSTYGYGNDQAGLYGHGSIDTALYAIISTIKFGNITLNNQIVSFREKTERTIGTNFFKNYKVIINWFTNEITLIKNKDYDNTQVKHFGFIWTYNDNKLFVGMIYKSDDPAFQGLKIGDHILEIDGKDLRKCTLDNWCEIMNNGLIGNVDTASILVLRENKELNFKLTKKNLFNNN